MNVNMYHSRRVQHRCSCRDTHAHSGNDVTWKYTCLRRVVLAQQSSWPWHGSSREWYFAHSTFLARARGQGLGRARGERVVQLLQLLVVVVVVVVMLVMLVVLAVLAVLAVLVGLVGLDL